MNTKIRHADSDAVAFGERLRGNLAVVHERAVRGSEVGDSPYALRSEAQLCVLARCVHVGHRNVVLDSPPMSRRAEARSYVRLFVRR